MTSSNQNLDYFQIVASISEDGVISMNPGDLGIDLNGIPLEETEDLTKKSDAKTNNFTLVEPELLPGISVVMEK